MKQHRNSRWLAVIAAVLSVCTPLVAESPAVDRYVLLKSGRVMAGQVQQDARGYLVIGRNGRLHAPYEYVQLVADSLHDVYRHSATRGRSRSRRKAASNSPAGAFPTRFTTKHAWS